MLLDVKVGATIRRWIIDSYGKDVITLDRKSNLWTVVKQNLDTRPEDYTHVKDKSEYIFINILVVRGSKAYNNEAERQMYCNELYRCYLTERGVAAVKRYLENSFRAAFREYMIARYTNGESEKIRHAITSFLLDHDLPVEKRMIARLSKDWYRFRQKNPQKFPIPLFF